MLSGATFRASAIVGTAVFRIVVSSDSMKNATATSHGNSRLLDAPASITVTLAGRRAPWSEEIDVVSQGVFAVTPSGFAGRGRRCRHYTPGYRLMNLAFVLHGVAARPLFQAPPFHNRVHEAGRAPDLVECPARAINGFRKSPAG